jgi:hypothetical protein
MTITTLRLAICIIPLAACVSGDEPEDHGADTAANAVVSALDVRAEPAPEESHVRWDLATAAQVAAFHDAARARAGVAKGAAIDAAVAELEAAGVPASAAAVDALHALDARSAIGITPRFDTVRGELRMVSDLGWFARGATAEDAAGAFTAAHAGELATLLGIVPERELFLAGTNDLGDATGVVFRSRCNGVEVAGSAVIVYVTKSNHWLGAGVVDALYAESGPGLACPYAARDLISEARAAAIALDAVASPGVDVADCGGELRLGLDGVYAWRVSCPFAREDVSDVVVDARTGSVIALGEPDNAVSGHAADEFQIGSGLRFPDDVPDAYPMKYLRVYAASAAAPCWDSSCAFVDDADGAGWFSNTATAAGTKLEAWLASAMLPPMTYGATGVFRVVNDGATSLCDDAIHAQSYPVAGDGTVTLLDDAGPARVYYLLNWSRERYAGGGHELPQRLGFSVYSGSSGQAGYCSGDPYTHSRIKITAGANDGSVMTTLHEADHTWEQCANVAGWGCGGNPDNGADGPTDTDLGALAEGHADYAALALTEWVRSYGSGGYDPGRFYESDTSTTDYFIHKDDVQLGACPCNGGTGDVGPETCVMWGTTPVCMLDCTAASDCTDDFGPTAICDPQEVASDPTLMTMQNVCLYVGHENGGLFRNAAQFTSIRSGTMYGFELLADGLELGWNDSTRLSGPTTGNNVYAKVWSAYTADRYTTWRGFSPVFRNLTYADAGDDFTSWSRQASVIASTGNLTTTIDHGTAYGDPTANIDYSGDSDYVAFKAARGESYTVTMTQESGTLDACAYLYAVPSGGAGFSLLAYDTNCAVDGTLTSTVTFTVPLGATYDWILLRAAAVGATTGAYALTLDMTGDAHADHQVSSPTWQDALPVAANTGAVKPGSKTAGDTDWFKVFVPTSTTSTALTIAYPSAGFLPRTWLYRGLSGSGGPGTALASGDGTTFIYTVPAADSGQWYWFLVGSPFSSTTGSYTVQVGLAVSGLAIDPDWSSVAAPYPLQFGWGDQVADGLGTGDVDAFRVTLARGDRFTADIVPRGTCDTSVAVHAPLLPSGFADAFGADPFLWDDNNGADLDAWGYGDSLTFVAPRDGDYVVRVQPGPEGCSTDYTAYFFRGIDEPASNLAPAFDRTPGL